MPNKCLSETKVFLQWSLGDLFCTYLNNFFTVVATEQFAAHKYRELHLHTVTRVCVSAQVVDLYSEDGLERPFFCTIETPFSGNVIKITNTGPREFPLTSSIVRPC